MKEEKHLPNKLICTEQYRKKKQDKELKLKKKRKDDSNKKTKQQTELTTNSFLSHYNTNTHTHTYHTSFTASFLLFSQPPNKSWWKVGLESDKLEREREKETHEKHPVALT